jgi:hypothetical protein
MFAIVWWWDSRQKKTENKRSKMINPHTQSQAEEARIKFTTQIYFSKGLIERLRRSPNSSCQLNVW